MSQQKKKFQKRVYLDINDERSFETYYPQFKDKSTISEKMKALSKLSSLSDLDVAQRNKILLYINNMLQPYFPDCSVRVFGSSLNGFGTKGCDLDLMFFPAHHNDDLNTQENTVDETVPSLKMVKSSTTQREQLKHMRREKQLIFVLKVLRSDRIHFKKGVFIPARCPIIKFLWVQHNYQVSCDLSFRHRLAIFNSELLHLFGIIDPRVKPLVASLRFWAKHLGFVKTGLLSSYAFTLLIIFFLQCLENPILPSVDLLMKDTETCIIDGWEVGFTRDLKNVPKSTSKETEGELLEQFFKFYWNFDFMRFVVCVRSGKPVLIKDLVESPDERIKTFVVRNMCIQDPFDLSHNVASSAQPEDLMLFKPYLFVASKIISKKLHYPVTQDFFELLYEEEVYKSNIKDFFFSCDTDNSVGILINPDFEIAKVFEGCDNFEKIWFKCASAAVLDILKYIFFFDCEVIDQHCGLSDVVQGKYSFATENDQQIHILLSRIQCAVDIRLWEHRKITRNVALDSYTENFSNCVLKEENALSNYVLAKFPALQCPEPFLWFLCDCYKIKYSQFPSLYLNFKPLTNSKEFKSVCNILRTFIPKTVKKIMLS